MLLSSCQACSFRQNEPVKTAEVKGFDVTQNLPLAEVGKAGNILGGLALIEPAQGLQTTKTFFCRRAVHGDARPF